MYRFVTIHLLPNPKCPTPLIWKTNGLPGRPMTRWHHAFPTLCCTHWERRDSCGCSSSRKHTIMLCSHFFVCKARIYTSVCAEHVYKACDCSQFVFEQTMLFTFLHINYIALLFHSQLRCCLVFACGTATKSHVFSSSHLEL